MVTPDNKVDPNRRLSDQTQKEEVKRKPPSRDFREVTEQIDERRDKGEGGQATKFDKKKNAVASKSKVPSHVGPLSIFDIARAQDNTDVDSESPSKRHTSELISSVGAKERREGFFGAVEQPDLAAIAMSSSSPLSSFNSAMASSKTAMVNATQSLQEIVDQIVKEVYTLKNNGLNETVVSLKGMFDGSQLIVTESPTAKGQFNITIDNLNATTQALVEANKKALLTDLGSKNIVVHIFTASAILEPNRIENPSTSPQPQKSFRDNEDKEQNKKQQR